MRIIPQATLDGSPVLAVCKVPSAELMSESVEMAEFVDVCFALSAFRRPESAVTKPVMRLEVSIPDPTPLRLLSAMFPASNERSESRIPQRFFWIFWQATKQDRPPTPRSQRPEPASQRDGSQRPIRLRANCGIWLAWARTAVPA